MGCATGVVKYLVFLANLIFVIIGLALIVIGIIYKTNYGDLEEVLPSQMSMAPVLTIIFGAVVFITAFWGCCGAIKESPCMLQTYAITLLTIFIIQVAVGIYLFVNVHSEDDVRAAIRKPMQKVFREYHDRNGAASELVSFIQKTLKCCGSENWSEMRFANGSLPVSCCKDQKTYCESTYANNYYTEGCIEAAFNFFITHSDILAKVAIGVAVFEILGAIFGLCLASYINRHYSRNIYT